MVDAAVPVQKELAFDVQTDLVHSRAATTAATDGFILSAWHCFASLLPNLTPKESCSTKWKSK